MRLLSFLFTAALVAHVASHTEKEPTENAVTDPELDIIAAWNENNVFGQVVNGERNVINFDVENKSERNLTLISIAGSVLNADTNALIKNLTAQTFAVPLISGVKMRIPYMFYSEFKPGEVKLHVWIDHTSPDAKYRVTAYDSIVTIVEPEYSIYDFKLVTTYLIVAVFLGGLVYVAFLSFVPQQKKARSKRPPVPATPVSASGAATGTSLYEEEWIPEHHLRKTKRKGGAASGTSGDELSGGETSGAEGKRRKGSKK